MKKSQRIAAAGLLAAGVIASVTTGAAAAHIAAQPAPIPTLVVPDQIQQQVDKDAAALRRWAEKRQGCPDEAACREVDQSFFEAHVAWRSDLYPTIAADAVALGLPTDTAVWARNRSALRDSGWDERDGYERAAAVARVRGEDIGTNCWPWYGDAGVSFMSDIERWGHVQAMDEAARETGTREDAIAALSAHADFLNYNYYAGRFHPAEGAQPVTLDLGDPTARNAAVITLSVVAGELAVGTAAGAVAVRRRGRAA